MSDEIDVTPEAVERLAKSLAFVANRTGMTVEKCEIITDCAADTLRALSARLAALEAAKWDVQHTDTMNSIVQIGMARDQAEARAKALEAQLAQAVDATRTDTIPSQDALIRAALEVASRRIYVLVSNEGRGFYRRGRGGYSNGIDACHDAIREMMDDPGELARIKAKAAEEGLG
jgi:hypothetical protein